jgi:hypothetical protein
MSAGGGAVTEVTKDGGAIECEERVGGRNQENRRSSTFATKVTDPAKPKNQR